ncbi:MAG: acyl carrier protein [Oscillospiraceae bacterium]|nr:acyl carrier protein [Oscillospiraceae bacterium]
MIFDKVKEIIADQLGVDEDSIAMDSDIVEDLGADSIDAIDLILSVQEEFDIEIPDEAVEGIKTISDIVKYIEDAQ